ncbi:MAG: hypothetical protein IPK60_11015 [Sandaracinaceae bacterium]|jgi:hypothetical protein|nr:hypothetical protein [Sandaracinaceae bacterium]
MRPSSITFRRALLLAVLVTVITGIFAGLARVGVSVPWGTAHVLAHGPLLVLGAFVTVIGLERAVALGKHAGYMVPTLGASGAILTLAHVQSGAWLFVAATLALVAVNAMLVRRQRSDSTLLMLLGSLVLFGGTLAWALKRPIFEVVHAWIAFFVLTIIAERLELSRLAPTPRWAAHMLVVLSVVVSICSVASIFDDKVAGRLTGCAFVLLGLWGMRFDLARRTVSKSGLPRYAAIAVLLAMSWLVVSGALFLSNSRLVAGSLYDASLHAVFVGFVFSMVFAHAPIILPAVAKIEIPFRAAFYFPLVLLHTGLLARVTGDVTDHLNLRVAGSVASASALPIFAAAAIWARIRKAKPTP